ncbi:MAG: sialidase family protein [Pirellulales bacterium]
MQNRTRLPFTGLLFVATVLILTEVAVGQNVQFKAVGKEPESGRYRSCRRLIVGPWRNQPEEYEGYNGFVGWSGVTRLRSGRWLVTFTSGAWHATPPWTEAIRQDPKCRKSFEEWRKIGLPDIRAPRGGRCHIMHSDDAGLTWSKPVVLVDTEEDDRHPTILELDDGTLICTFFTYRFPREISMKYVLSHDGGLIWTEPIDPLGKPAIGAFGNGPIIQLADGSVLWVAEGRFDETHPHSTIGVMRLMDQARNRSPQKENDAARSSLGTTSKSFELISVVKADHELNEPTIVELPTGRLVMVIRREGDICWSDDGGRTWEQSGSTGWGLYDPHLLCAPNGVLACFHGSYKKGGIRVLLSPDGGRTWNGPGEGYGYRIDPSVYGYSHPMLLPDGTIFLVYLHTGGHRPADARTEALWGLRVKIHDDAGGVDILPAAGSSDSKPNSRTSVSPGPRSVTNAMDAGYRVARTSNPSKVVMSGSSTP